MPITPEYTWEQTDVALHIVISFKNVNPNLVDIFGRLICYCYGVSEVFLTFGAFVGRSGRLAS